MAVQSKMASRINGACRKPRAAAASHLILTHPSSSLLRYTAAAAAAAADPSHQSLVSYSRLVEVLSPPVKRQTNPASRRIAPFSGKKRIKSSIPPPTDVTTAAAVSDEIAAVAAPRILPPPSVPRRNTMFLDLDMTLVHSKFMAPPERYDFIVRPCREDPAVAYYVLKRPGVHDFLRAAADSFEVVVFTASTKEYADLIVDWLDPEGKMIAHRLYRDSCKDVDGVKNVKDLSGLGRDLEKVVIVDDKPRSYALQPENAIPVTPFVDDLADRELERLTKFFDVAGSFDDMREAVKSFLSSWKINGER
ncbi:Mitochondrial import inner membrane translocase subunit TIM50 [Apostasia shenzhenica]|uniref:Mitochondrial import inner membrane translocase subunit TIM50 n=1 Tax=Apostasia shenzhenica TaxID=1088818 RepID=A0A2H9ZU88_9ASPA|nr:Mitochondrial import inner membrane translocase subunit TIM50 [Apostasia shenzhenica]